ncbi:unnamed protein product [Fusarium venenatum]|uniref:DUF6594 domain-containing protein n=1 Tax=Fusarium venenatum TaxID=56646 RepID=A0A2L2SXU3_9HYPO|nr:uncharacterized protein FVRRES_13616 [Fusarium venenatum]CEI41519.1 unnamed protein product [Fusarium venenatum]
MKDHSDNEEFYGDRLFRYVFDQGQQEPRFLIFRGLQLMNIFNMQNDLARLIKHDYDNKDRRTPADTLGPYHRDTHCPLTHRPIANAIRDYEYLTRLTPITGPQARRGRLDLERAPAIVISPTPPTDNLCEVLKRHLPFSMTNVNHDYQNRTKKYFNNEPPEQVSPMVDLARFLVVFLGGSMLVVPMLVMRLPEVTVVKSLVTVSISVFAIAGALSIFSKASYTETMVATYAAVLVVFVGVSD